MFGAATQGAYTGGVKNLQNLLGLQQAMQQARQQQLARAQLGDYMQQTLAPPPQTPAPGQASVPMQQPGGNKVAAAGGDFKTPQSQPSSMSLDGLMSFLKDRGITGADALATADQFAPYMAAEDKQKLGQMKFQIDMEKLLIANGFDAAKAKNEAARIAAYNKRTQAMYGKGGQKDKIQALTHTVQQLTVGRQKLAQQRDSIVNGARNAGRMLTAQEQATIQAINTKIQAVDTGMQAVRSQQALLMSGLNYGAQPDSMEQSDTDDKSAADSVTNDLDDSGGGGG